METLIEYLSWIAYSAGYLVCMLAFLWLGKLIFDLLTPYSLRKQLTEKDNPAVGILITGYLVGLVAIICGLFYGDAPETAPTIQRFAREMVPIWIYGGISLLLLHVGGFINDRFILYRFSNQQEIAEKSNKAVAIVMGATYIGTGLLIAGGICGSVNIVSLLGAFILGSLALTLYALMYQWITRYDDQKELGERQNVAAALAYGGNIIGYSLILMKGAALPEYMDEGARIDRLIYWAYYAGAGVVLLVVIRALCDWLFLTRVKIHREITEDRNPNAGLIEGTLAMAFGAAMVFCL